MPLFILPKSSALILGQGESLPPMSPRKHPANVEQNYQFPCWQDHALLFVWNFGFSVQPWSLHDLKYLPARFYCNSWSSEISVITDQGNNSGRIVALPKHLYPKEWGTPRQISVTHCSVSAGKGEALMPLLQKLQAATILCSLGAVSINISN